MPSTEIAVPSQNTCMYRISVCELLAELLKNCLLWTIKVDGGKLAWR